jgi:HPt (histidine-containing phosphotransfer) domain-containing protein
MFLENGFDEFISKPIDIRVLDKILTEYISSKHPEEAIKYAGQKSSENKMLNKNSAPQKLIDAFLRDADKALTAMTEALSSNDIKNFAIYAHGMKSGLLSIGEDECSNMAKTLEFAAKANDTKLITDNFDEFYSKLEKIVLNLKSNLKPVESDFEYAKNSEYIEYVKSAITACGSYDNRNAKQSVEQIMTFTLPQNVKSAVEKISVLIFHAEFEEASEELSKLLDELQ